MAVFPPRRALPLIATTFIFETPLSQNAGGTDDRFPSSVTPAEAAHAPHKNNRLDAGPGDGYPEMEFGPRGHASSPRREIHTFRSPYMAHVTLLGLSADLDI